MRLYPKAKRYAMNKNLTATFATTLSLIGFAPAQQVSFAISAPTPLVASVTNGQSVTNWTGPSGPLSSIGYFPIPASNGFLTWSSASSETESFFYFDQRGGGGSSVVEFGRNEILLEVRSAIPQDSILRIEGVGILPSGASETYQVDVGDDGTIELTEDPFSFGFVEIPVTLGPQPLPVRLFVTTTSGPLGVQTSLNISARPDNGLAIDPAAFGCSGLSDDFRCTPIFGNDGVRFELNPVLSSQGFPTVIALGLDVAPVLLPGVQPGLPCLLLPRPDAVLTGYGYDQAIPPAVRPIALWGQAVFLEQGFLRTSAAYRVFAR